MNIIFILLIVSVVISAIWSILRTIYADYSSETHKNDCKFLKEKKYKNCRECKVLDLCLREAIFKRK